MPFSAPITVPYYEVQDYPRERETWKTGIKRRRFRVAWADRHSFVAQITTPPNNVYPYDNSFATAHKTAIVPWDLCRLTWDTYFDIASYEWAMVDIEYTTDIYASAMLSEELHPENRMHHVDHRWFEWADGEPLTAGENPVRYDCGLTYYLTYMKTFFIPASAIAAAGSTNDAPFAMKVFPYTFNTGFLLYRGPTGNVTRYDVGVRPAQVTYKFSYVYRDGTGWNGVWRALTGQHEIVNNHAGVQVALNPSASFAGF
jgi:hypothetical protein